MKDIELTTLILVTTATPVFGTFLWLTLLLSV